MVCIIRYIYDATIYICINLQEFECFILVVFGSLEFLKEGWVDEHCTNFRFRSELCFDSHVSSRSTNNCNMIDIAKRKKPKRVLNE